MWIPYEHPDMPGFALYSPQLDDYYRDTDGSVMWFASRAEAERYKQNNHL